MKTQKHGLASMYKKLIASLVIILVLLGVIIIYFTLNKVEITVFPKLVNKQTQFYVDVYEEIPNSLAGNEMVMNGQIEEINAEASGTYQSTGEKEVVNDDDDYPVVGEVTLFNDQSSSQQLVRKTRLLNTNEKLFRLNEEVSIPAKGSVIVEVYYDPEETEFDKVEAGKFTIPGLSESMQSVVYAESYEPFARPGTKVNFVQKSDIEDAMQDLSAKRLEEVVDGLKAQHGGDVPVALAYVAEVLGHESDFAEGEVADEFTITIDLKVIAVILNHDEIYDIIDSNLQANVGEGYQLVNLNFQNLKYFVDKYDLVSNSAYIEVLAEGNLSLTAEHSILDKTNFVALTKEQLIQYFQTVEEIKETEIKFYPSWLKKVPSMLDHIHINIQ